MTRRRPGYGYLLREMILVLPVICFLQEPAMHATAPGLDALITLPAASPFAAVAKPGNFAAHIDDGPLLVSGGEIPIDIQGIRLRLLA